MAFDNGGAGLEVGSVTVSATSNTGLPVEHWVERAMKHIIHVADGQPAPIRDQAYAFQDHIRTVVEYYIRQAIKSDRTTLYNLFLQQGHKDMAEILRKL